MKLDHDDTVLLVCSSFNRMKKTMANETSMMLRGTNEMLRVGIGGFDDDWD